LAIRFGKQLLDGAFQKDFQIIDFNEREEQRRKDLNDQTSAEDSQLR
jgi:hypothetical protein